MVACAVAAAAALGLSLLFVLQVIPNPREVERSFHEWVVHHGESPSEELSTRPAFLLPAVTTLYNVGFQDDTYKNLFTLDYDYTQHNTDGEARHFLVETAPGGVGKALRICIYSGDQPFKADTPTYPRTELSGSGHKMIQDNVAYTVQWDQYIHDYVAGYWFCFAQIFGSGPNVMLRWELDNYQIWSNGQKALLSGNVNQDLTRWVTWRMDFLLSTSGGYVKVYRDGALLGAVKGDTASGVNSYWKQGIYTQHVNSVENTKIFVRNLVMKTA